MKIWLNQIFQAERPVASIAYFLEKRTKSPTLETKMFRCQSTEMVFYHAGLPVSIYIVDKVSKK